MLESPWRMMDMRVPELKLPTWTEIDLMGASNDSSRQAMTAMMSWRPGTVVFGKSENRVQ